MKNKNYSLQKRLLLNTAVVLIVFIAAMSIILLKSYTSGIKRATFERLNAQFYGLLSEAEQISADELFIPEEPQLDQRFNQFASGLSALVFDETETLIWKSISAETDTITLPTSLPGDPTFVEEEIKQKTFFKFHYITEWESEEGDISLYHFVLLENKRPFDQVISAYRNTLWLWLSILALSLLFILFLVLRWSLRPMRKMVKELNNVKQGIADSLGDDYPNEIQQLTDNINLFINNERHQSKRYKETLANLAHSLKTPLAVMQTALQNKTNVEQLINLSKEQLLRMDQIVAYQLQRATSGPQVMMQSVALAPAINKLISGLEKVYLDKGIRISSEVDLNLKIYLNEGDLYEVCGNLLDNACKWASSRVHFNAQKLSQQLVIEIEDDGPGIPEQVRLAVLSRGKRLDEDTEGQGIGMSVVSEIIQAYGANIDILTSERLSGALIRLTFNR